METQEAENRPQSKDFENLDRYYLLHQNHLKWSFWSSLVALSVGLLVVIAGIVVYFSGNNSLETVLPTIGGILTEFVGAGFFYLYSKNLKQLNIFYNNLVKSQDTQMAISLAFHKVSDDKKDDILETIILTLLTRNEPKTNTEITPELIRAMTEAKK